MLKRVEVYARLVKSPGYSIPIEDASGSSIVSNSVLEHPKDLKAVLGDLFGILRRGGVLMFTVPVIEFERHLVKCFGQYASDKVYSESFHINLLEVPEWTKFLEDAGFQIMTQEEFQPDWFTFWFRMFRFFGDRGLECSFRG